MLFTNKVLFVKKNRVTQSSKLVTKIKKHSQLYFGTLVLTSYCCCGDKAENTDFSQYPGFKESSNMSLQRVSKATINFHEKQCLSGITQNKKH